MNDKTIQTIAEAILANTRVLQSLVDALPREVQQAVAEQVKAPTVTPPAPVAQAVAPAPAPVVQAPPVPMPEMPAVVQAVAANAMPAPPVFQQPVAPALAQPSGNTSPFSNIQDLTQYVLDTYKAIGPAKGSGIQKILSDLNYRNINDIRPEHWGDFYAGIEALKAS
jgi:phosphoribosylformylglycinamidine (FGAM) synthase PurS component